MPTEQLTAVPRIVKNCPRCGQTFHTNESVYLCEACRQPKTSTRAAYGKELTFREKQIIEMVSQAKLNKEIAYELHLSEGTVKEYLHRIFRKVGVKNRTDLALWAFASREIVAA